MKTPAAKPACPRLFEAEALRDGRLSGAEETRFQSHARSCAACAHELQSMQALADALRAPTNLREADELHVRRERTRLLAAFDASLVPAARGAIAKFWLPAVAALALAGAALALFSLRPHPTALPVAASEPVQVSADGSSKWSRHAENQLQTITLESGTLSIRVAHDTAAPERRLLVLLPDGELEDIGTTFSVSAAAAHTTQVSVQNGSVILRLRNLPALTLRAGDTWTPAATAPSATTSVDNVANPPASSPSTLGGHGTKTTAVAAPPASVTPSAVTPSAVTPGGAAPESDPATAFRAAMSALNSGNNANAAARFAAFVSQYPRDSHAEDAAYLRVLALQRAGSSNSMKQAASEYLARYPHGFRRAEIEPLAQ